MTALNPTATTTTATTDDTPAGFWRDTQGRLVPEDKVRDIDKLRELGRNLHPGRFAGLRGRGWKAELLQKMAERWADKQPDGQLSLTFEIVYGHAYKPQPKLRLEANSAVSLEDMKAMLKQPRNTGLR